MGFLYSARQHSGLFIIAAGVLMILDSHFIFGPQLLFYGTANEVIYFRENRTKAKGRE